MIQTIIRTSLSAGMGFAVLLLATPFALQADELLKRRVPVGLNPEAVIDAGAQILAVDEAFRFGSFLETDGLKLFWQVAPGYFLYRDKFQFVIGDKQIQVSLAPGEYRLDEIFGEVQVLDGLVEVTLPATSQLVSVHYQGCAEKGFCYPPQEKILNSEK